MERNLFVYSWSGTKFLELGIRQTTVVLSNADRKCNHIDDHVKIKEFGS